MKILVEDITATPTELALVEDDHALNQILTQQDGAEYRLTSPLQVCLLHVRTGDDLLFTGNLEGQVVGHCARCLEEYPMTLARDVSVVLTPARALGREMELSSAELSASFYRGESVDLSLLVQEQVLLALPSQPLCREECRGLCTQCGTNLNRETCECRPTWRDSRLDIFATLRVARRRVAK